MIPSSTDQYSTHQGSQFQCVPPGTGSMYRSERILVRGRPSTGWYQCFDLVSWNTTSVPGDNSWNPTIIETYRSVRSGFQPLSRCTSRYDLDFDCYWGVPVGTPRYSWTATYKYFWKFFFFFGHIVGTPGVPLVYLDMYCIEQGSVHWYETKLRTLASTTRYTDTIPIQQIIKTLIEPI